MDLSPFNIVVFLALSLSLKECAGWSSWNYIFTFSVSSS